MDFIDHAYFRLFPDVIFKKGVAGGAIYLLTRARILSLEPRKSKLLDMLEKNCTVAEAAAGAAMELPAARNFLKTLVILKAGCFLKQKGHIEKVRHINPIQEIAFFRPPPTIRLLHLVLSHRCSQNCFFCDDRTTAVRRLHPCINCWKGEENIEALSAEIIEKVIEAVSVFEGRRLMLHAGDGGLVEDLLAASLEAAAKFDFQSIEMVTGTAMNDRNLDLLIRHQAVPVYQVFSSRPQPHDRVARTDGSFERLCRNFKTIQQKGGAFKLAYLHTGIDIHPERQVAALKQFGPTQIYSDRLFSENVRKSKFAYGSEVLTAPDVKFYAESKNTPSCLSGRLALGVDGNFYPCPLLSKNPLGSAAATSLQQLLADGSIQAYWDAPAANDGVCDGCEFQYGCYQCRIAAALYDDKKMICGYHPQTGLP